MKGYLLLILLICTTLQAQTNFSQASGNQLDYFKLNFNDLKDQNGNIIFKVNESDPIVMGGEFDMDAFGNSVSSAGDANGDGYLDVIVGASNYGDSDTGKAYIFYGSALMDNIADVTMIGAKTVSSAGDINGDGYSDVIVGDNSVKIYFGGSSMDNFVDVILTNSGLSTSAGDVNGDGYSDVIVGSKIYFGDSSMDNVADVILASSGYSSSAGDLNGDGYSDVIVGSNIYCGGSSMNNIVDVILSNSVSFVSCAGDVNGDIYSDVIVSGYGFTNCVYVYFGGLSMNNIADVTMKADYLGNSVSSAGDVNGDGFSDVIVGQAGYNNGQGRIFIYYGGSSMDTVVDVTITGVPCCPIGNFFGCSVSSFSDGSGIIIGENGGPNGFGKAFLYRFYSSEPFLINPLNNSTINPLTIYFKWSKYNSALYYILEISTTSLFNNIIVNDTIYADTSKEVSGFQKETKYFWRVRAKDTSGVMINSLVSNFSTIPPVTANIKLLFEGMYSPIYNQLSRKDSITLYLRISASPFAISDSAKNNIDTISFSNIFKFNNTTAGNHYIVVKHFNSIETWSREGGENLVSDTIIYHYDFTTSNAQAYGNSLNLKGSKYCLYSGDVNQDGYVTLFDVIPIYNDASGFVTGRFIRTDLTGDNIVDLTDVTLCYNNSFNFVRVIKP